jgi:2-polyprenyl-6-hydroxyphenyl methylase/3-demethylubiquinone-9 3-methyltransferase
LGAKTVAIDASNENVQTATLHASQDPSLLQMLENGQLEYKFAAAEHLLEAAQASGENGVPDASGQFDIVCAMEVIEHVSDPPSFLRCLSELIKVGSIYTLCKCRN